MLKFIFPVIAWLAGLHFIGVLLAWFLGSSLDRFFAYGVGGINPLSKQKRQEIFMQTVFLLKGKLAKSDGKISQHEIDHVEQFMAQLGMTAEHRKQAINLFKQGAADDFVIDATLDTFMSVCGHTHNLKHLLLVFLIAMAFSDGVFDHAEDTLLKSVAKRLGFSESDYKNLVTMVQSQAQFAGGKSATTESDLQKAYSALNVSANNSDQEIKRAYRKLMSQYHPDKLMGQGVPEDMINVATETTKEIQAAYDLIKEQRKKNA